jgi:hypothetical protein
LMRLKNDINEIKSLLVNALKWLIPKTLS